MRAEGAREKKRVESPRSGDICTIKCVSEARFSKISRLRSKTPCLAPTGVGRSLHVAISDFAQKYYGIVAK